MNKLIFLFLIFLAITVKSQDVISEDSLFQDPIERKAYIFEHLTLPDILWDNGVPLVDFSGVRLVF